MEKWIHSLSQIQMSHSIRTDIAEFEPQKGPSTSVPLSTASPPAPTPSPATSASPVPMLDTDDPSAPMVRQSARPAAVARTALPAPTDPPGPVSSGVGPSPPTAFNGFTAFTDISTSAATAKGATSLFSNASEWNLY